MTKLETLENKKQKAEDRLADYMTKVKKEEEKLQQLETQIILAKHEEQSNYLAEHNLTWADIETALAEGKLKGAEKDVPFNQSDTKHDHNV